MKHIKLFENWQEGNSLEYAQDTDSVTPEQAKDLITNVFVIKNEGEMVKPIMLIGAPGVGKEAVIKKAAKEAGVEPIMLDLSFMSPEDFMGVPRLSTREIPNVNPEEPGVMSGTMKDSIPSWFPVDGSGIIVLGSINRAEGQIANAAIHFAQSGRLGTNQLPEGWLIVATADGADDISTVISDRFTVLNLG
jgi:MoxR-like ATPase